MKKLFAVIAVMMFIAFAGVAIAQEAEVKVPTKINATDYLVGNTFINTALKQAPNGKVVAIFHDVVPAQSQVPMMRKGNNWIVQGGVGADVHPAVITPDGKIIWCVIEAVWSTGSDFVKMRPAGPCLRVN